MYVLHSALSGTSSTGGSSAGIKSGPWKVVDKEIGTGDRAIRNTVADMRRLARRDAADPAVVAIAQKLKVPGDDLQSARNAFDYVPTNVPYKSDPAAYELLVAPKYTLSRQWIGEDCDGQMMALVALLIAMGDRCWFRILDWKPGANAFTHVNVVCELPGKNFALALDPILKSDGFGKEQRPVKRHEFYEV